MPEKFDFSKTEEQEKAKRLSSSDREKVSFSAEAEGKLMQKIINEGGAENFNDAEKVLSEIERKMRAFLWEKIPEFEKIQKISENQEKNYNDYINKLNNDSRLEKLIQKEVEKKLPISRNEFLSTSEVEKERLKESVQKVVFNPNNTSFQEITDLTKNIEILLKELISNIPEELEEIKEIYFGKTTMGTVEELKYLENFILRYPTHLEKHIYYYEGKIGTNHISLSKNIIPGIISLLEHLLLEMRDYKNWEQKVESKIISIPESYGKFAVHSAILTGAERILEADSRSGDSWVPDERYDFKNPMWGFWQRLDHWKNFSLENAQGIQTWLFENNNFAIKRFGGNVKLLTEEQYQYVKDHPIIDGAKEQDNNTMQILEQIRFVGHSWNLNSAQFGLMTRDFAYTRPDESKGSFNEKDTLGIVLYVPSKINLEMTLKMMERVCKNNLYKIVPIYDNEGNLLWPKKMTKEEASEFVKQRNEKLKIEDLNKN